MLESYKGECPYCGENFYTSIDTSAGSQSYIEDCQICCHPIVFDVQIDFDGHIDVHLKRDSD